MQNWANAGVSQNRDRGHTRSLVVTEDLTIGIKAGVRLFATTLSVACSLPSRLR